jgi:hypothetical protein
VALIAPVGTVDAGDAGIRSSGNLSIAAAVVQNASNIQVQGSSTGVPAAAPSAAPPVAAMASTSDTAGAAAAAAESAIDQARPTEQKVEEVPSLIVVEVIGYGGEEEDDDASAISPAPEATPTGVDSM